MYEKFIKSIEKCLELSQKELADRKAGINGESTIEQLENQIIPELTDLTNQIKNGIIPPKNE